VAAGVRPIMERDLFDHKALRMISPSFMLIEQAMATPIERGEAGQDYLAAFVEEQKASGFVAEALKRSGQNDATVAPSAQRLAEPALG
jgi:polar amino acid transport system substrate-binding protein